jgi:hypothetical protein
MVSSEYYRDQARIFMEWAERSDAKTAAQLRKRAEEYLILAKALEGPDTPLPPSPLSAELGQSAVQQQQQIQPDTDPEKE